VAGYQFTAPLAAISVILSGNLFGCGMRATPRGSAAPRCRKEPLEGLGHGPLDARKPARPAAGHLPADATMQTTIDNAALDCYKGTILTCTFVDDEVTDISRFSAVSSLRRVLRIPMRTQCVADSAPQPNGRIIQSEGISHNPAAAVSTRIRVAPAANVGASISTA
jgi:hypothetical protein